MTLSLTILEDPDKALFQEAAKESKAALLSPDDQEDAESPLPSNIVQPVRRRGAISAEPINEEDAATYIKKVWETIARKLRRFIMIFLVHYSSRLSRENETTN